MEGIGVTTSQQDRIDTILRQLHEAERERRQVAASGPTPDSVRHSHLANLVREQIGQLPAADLKSLALRMVVDTVNGDKWSRCHGCGRPDYLGQAKT
jgi:predicted nucleic acid-binding Zn ribbon protein